jgi:hypothetical protein
VGHRDPEGLDGLSRQRAAALVGDGHREHQGNLDAQRVEGLVRRDDGRLGVERVEDGLDEQHVDSTLDERVDLLGVGTSGEMESVLLVGPTAPATKRGLSGVRSLQARAVSTASCAARRLISRTAACMP